MFSGEIPGLKILRRIMRAENVSMTWLTEGVGAPYVVHGCPTDEDCRQYVDELLDFQEWTVHHLSDGGRVEVLVFHAPTQIEYPDEPIFSYTEINVVAGAGRLTRARLYDLRSYRETLSNTETVSRVADGREAGTWPLIGKDGLLSNYRTVTPSQEQVAESTPALYASEANLSLEEQEIVELYRRLSPRNRIRWRDVGEAFLHTPRDQELAGEFFRDQIYDEGKAGRDGEKK